MGKVKIQKVKKLSEIFDYLSKIKIKNDSVLAYRGEKEDYSKKNTELWPFIYRDNYLENEDKIFRESQRFNNQEFFEDRTTFDKLSRIQHYSAPTRLLDISEDLMSALYFAIGEKKDYREDSIVYIFEIEKNKIKYYDSDTVSVISNIIKLPLGTDNDTDKIKSKKGLKKVLDKVSNYYTLSNKKIKKLNKLKSIQFLRHEIREEKPQFKPIIDPRHLTSIQCVRPKLTSGRIKSQKGFFLLFGLNPDNIKKPIQLIIKKKKLLNDDKIKHPIKKIHKIIVKSCGIENMKKDLVKSGIKKSFIYPEIDKVSEYLKEEFKRDNLQS